MSMDGLNTGPLALPASEHFPHPCGSKMQEQFPVSPTLPRTAELQEQIPAGQDGLNTASAGALGAGHARPGCD